MLWERRLTAGLRSLQSRSREPTRSTPVGMLCLLGIVLGCDGSRPSRSASCSAVFFLCREASPAHTRDCALSRAKAKQRLPRCPCWSAHMCNTLCSSTSPVLFFSVVAESCSCYHRQKGIGQSHLTFPYLVVQTVGRVAGEATPRSRTARTSCLCH